MSDDKKDKGATIIPFPKNRIVESSTAGPANAKVSTIALGDLRPNFVFKVFQAID